MFFSNFDIKRTLSYNLIEFQWVKYTFYVRKVSSLGIEISIRGSHLHIYLCRILVNERFTAQAKRTKIMTFVIFFILCFFMIFVLLNLPS